MKILIVDDEVNQALLDEQELTELGYEVESEYNGIEGYKNAFSNKYDVILLDIMLPGMDGMKICKKLREKGCNSYIIMLTAMDDEYNKITGLEIGADDYVTKPFSPRELAARIKAGLRRIKEENISDELVYKDLRIILSSYEVYKDTIKVELTLKEFELLEFLVLNKGKALSREQLLMNLWGYSYDGDSRIVDVHIFKLREKIDPSSNWIKTVRGIGYKLL